MNIGGERRPPAPSRPRVRGQEHIRTASGLEYVDVEAGDGPPAEHGMLAVFHYTGWLNGGPLFGSSLDRNEPIRARVGAGDLIRGWDEGLVGMRVGGRRRLVVPPELAYGSAGSGDGRIPPGATLMFVIELLALER